MTSAPTPRPEQVRAYIVAMVLLGWPVSFALAMSSGTTPAWQAGVLAITVLLSVWVPLRLQRGGDSHGVTVEEAVLVALLALGAGPWAGVLLGGAVTVGHLMLRSRPAKIAYNGAQVALSASAAAVTFRVLGADGAVLSPTWLAGLAAAVAVYASIGLIATTGLFVRLQGRSRRELFGESWRLVAATTTGNLMFGVVLAFLAVTDDRMLVMGVGLTIAVQIGYRGYVRIVHDRTRTELLQDTTRALVEVAASPERLGEVLVRLTALFGGRRAQLLLASSDGVRCLSASSEGAIDQADEHADRATREAFHRGAQILRPGSDDGPVSAIAVPVVYEGRVLGALAVLDRHGLEPWSPIDLGLLASLAHEAAVALRTIDLFEDVRLERQRFADESRKLTDVVNATSDGIVTLDVTGNVTVWNDAIAAITGTTADDALGRPWFTVLRLRDDHERDLGDQQRNVITEVLAESVPATGVDLQVLRRDGLWRWLRCTLNPVASQEGTSGVVVIARDVTAAIEIEQMKADFVATVSHELRTPLTPLMGFVETLDRFGPDLPDEHRQRAIDAMRSQLGRLGRLVDDLLTTTELDRGATQLELTPVVVGDRAETLVSRLPPSDRSRVALDAGDGSTVVTDAAAVDRIVGELVGNALKHTKGTVQVRVSALPTAVCVTVTDQGPGIGPQDHARVFERFGRLGDHLHRAQGPGLGLAIVRGLADELGGRVELDSGVDRGSTFTLTLPVPEPTTPALRPPLSVVH